MPKGNLTPAEKHQLKIAQKTLKMPDAMVGVMGGMTKAEAREIIEKLTGKRPSEALNGVRRLRMSKKKRDKKAGLVVTEALAKAVKAEVRRQLLVQKLSGSGQRQVSEAHREINFSPFAQNVLDYVGRKDLVTWNGKPVQIKRSGMGFEVVIDGKSYGTNMDNIEASYVLNSAQVGTRESVREQGGNWVAQVKQTWNDTEEAATLMAKAARILSQAGDKASTWGRNLARQQAQNADNFTTAGQKYSQVAKALTNLDRNLASADREYRAAMSKAAIESVTRTREAGRPFKSVRFKGSRPAVQKAAAHMYNLAARGGHKARRSGGTVYFDNGIDEGELDTLIDTVYDGFPEGDYPMAYTQR